MPPNFLFPIIIVLLTDLICSLETMMLDFLDIALYCFELYRFAGFGFFGGSGEIVVEVVFRLVGFEICGLVVVVDGVGGRGAMYRVSGRKIVEAWDFRVELLKWGREWVKDEKGRAMRGKRKRKRYQLDPWRLRFPAPLPLLFPGISSLVAALVPFFLGVDFGVVRALEIAKLTLVPEALVAVARILPRRSESARGVGRSRFVAVKNRSVRDYLRVEGRRKR